MNLDTPVEYFYGETMRWSFGFENPNKAAVLFACGLPLLWWCWIVGWRIRNRVLRGITLVLSATAVLGATYCLCMTFSRGGLVAAAVALIYLVGYEWWKVKPRSRLKWCLNTALIIAMVACVIWTGLGSRSASAVSGDASVDNRVELWSSALQMAVENPLGFGAGKSGEQYMQWYQPQERDQGYRTMVNSYLTFLVERGWIGSLTLLSCFAVFWVWTRPSGEHLLPTAMRGAIIGFMVAGLFSTTMEDWRLWMIPLSCGLALVILCIWRRGRLNLPRLGVVAAILLLACLSLALVGFKKTAADPLRREFGKTNGARTVVGISPKTETIGILGCVIDPIVLGEQSAKLIRQLALEGNLEIWLGERASSTDWALWMGQGVTRRGTLRPKRLILLAPEKIEQSALTDLLQNIPHVHLLLPEIDEDGRVNFWEDVADENSSDQLVMTTLNGVGNRVDWAWDQVVEAIKAERPLIE